MDSVEKLVALVGRVLLALVFVLGGYGKIWTIDATVAQMGSHGIPMPNLLVYGVILLELGGGLALMAGLFTRWFGLIFTLYLLTLALTFHNYWAMPAAQEHAQRVAFMEHLAMMGGMLYVFAFGAGAYSLDTLFGRTETVPATARA